ncbi:Sedoheptulokinase [Phytophthora megakarya]|uniref:Sedoheptulokinase n=1 Tax=Phytophthora megakarya TaxID=4795 RepID=A0A225URX3_9STRA|nr:Sedoheptulokinase [Phytophthora megakarya]
MEKPRQQNHYTVEQRWEALKRVAVAGCKPTARALNIPLGTLKGWRKKAKLLFEFKGAQTSRPTERQGAKSKITFERDLVTFMKDVRREEEYMKMEQVAWLEMYLSDKSSPESALSALMRLCQRFTARHGFSVQKFRYSKMTKKLYKKLMFNLQ